MREVPNDWKNIIPIFKMGNKDDLVNYRLVCFTSTLAKVIDQIFQKSIPSYRWQESEQTAWIYQGKIVPD